MRFAKVLHFIIYEIIIDGHYFVEIIAQNYINYILDKFYFNNLLVRGT